MPVHFSDTEAKRRERATERLNRLFKASGLTKAQFATKIDAGSRTVVYAWLAGTQEPGGRHLAAIAKRFGREAGWLLGLNNGYGTDGKTRGSTKGRELREQLLEDALGRAASFFNTELDEIRAHVKVSPAQLLETCGYEVSAAYGRYLEGEVRRVESLRKRIAEGLGAGSFSDPATTTPPDATVTDSDRDFGASSPGPNASQGAD